MYSRHLSLFFSGTPQHSLAVATPRKKNPHHSVLKQRRQLPNTDASSAKYLTYILQTSMENEPGLLSFILVNVNSCTLHLKLVLDEYNSMNSVCKMKVHSKFTNGPNICTCLQIFCLLNILNVNITLLSLHPYHRSLNAPQL